MSLVVTVTAVKEKTRVTDSSLDSLVANLIAQWVPMLEFAIRSEPLADTGNAGLQATLNLGAIEAVGGELLSQLAREPGAVESFSFGFFELGPAGGAAIDPSGLKAQGFARLRPFLKSPEFLAGTFGVAAGGSRTGEDE